MRILEYSASQDPDVMFAVGTDQDYSGSPELVAVASRASRAIRPADFNEVFDTVIFRTKALLELDFTSGVVV
jgi:hypothetical protein